MLVKKLKNSSVGVEISEIDLASASSEIFLEIAQLCIENLVVVIKNQHLSCADEIKMCSAIGHLEEVAPEFSFICPTDSITGAPLNSIIRVTGRKHPDGQPTGVLGEDNSDIDWHADRASAELDRKPLVWLYAVSGSFGSRTSWADCSAAYDDLDLATKQELRGLKGIFGFEPGRYTVSPNFKPHRNLNGIEMIQKTKGTNREGLYFPFLQLFGFKDRSKVYSDTLIERLTKHVTQEKYIYHHDWNDGDVVISEQWLTIHKRWACTVEKRLLHRITFDYENLMARGVKN